MRTGVFAAAAGLVAAGCVVIVDDEPDTRVVQVAPAAPAPTTPAEALRPFYAAFDADIPVLAQPTPLPEPMSRIERITLGSCLRPENDAPILASMAGEGADLALMLGDNVYGDAYSGDMRLNELRAAYAALRDSAQFAAVTAASPVLATWDDHDFGLNDAGGDFSAREYAETIFETFWSTPEDSRPGIYRSEVYGPPGEEVHVILLDTRYFRSPLKPTDDRGAPGKERYLPDPDPAKTMLGEAQWAWLQAELDRPARVKLIASSIQIIADGHGWEAWRTLPAERQRLYDAIGDRLTGGVVFLSGDRHRAGIYKIDDVATYPIYELTASSLNLPGTGRGEEPGPNRVGATYVEENYGVVDIDWARKTLTLSIKDIDGATVNAVTMDLDAMASG